MESICADMHSILTRPSLLSLRIDGNCNSVPDSSAYIMLFNVQPLVIQKDLQHDVEVSFTRAVKHTDNSSRGGLDLRDWAVTIR